jgi:hypothetical protein
MDINALGTHLLNTYDPKFYVWLLSQLILVKIINCSAMFGTFQIVLPHFKTKNFLGLRNQYFLRWWLFNMSINFLPNVAVRKFMLENICLHLLV